MSESPFKLPLKVVFSDEGAIGIADADNLVLLETKYKYDADFIVQACNSYQRDKEIIEKLVNVCKRICDWLDMLIKQSENQLRTCTFLSLADALKQDIENYKATKKDIEQVLAAYKNYEKMKKEKNE